MTIGALTPRSTAHVEVRVNGPKMLLSPAVKVVVTVITAGPPQHADGKPEVEVAPKLADVGIVARSRLQLTGVTVVSATTVSAMPSPLVSQASVAAVVTVLPGRCSGTPVCDWKPWQMIVVSFGKKPQPTRFSCTAHSALTRPVADGVVTNGEATTVEQISFAGGAQPMP